MPIYSNPKELASLQAGKKFTGKGSMAKNQQASEALQDTGKFISRIQCDIDASWNLTQEWRRLAVESYDFAENNQWDPKDKKTVEEEGRFALTFNDILPVVRILSGIERQKRESFKVLPREGGDVDAAQLMTELLAYVDDENLGFYQRVRKSQDVTCTGRGYIKTDISYEENINGDIIIKRINPLTIFNDPMAEEWDGTDRRWMAEGIWVTEEEAKELWPEFADQISFDDWLKSNTGTMPPHLIGDRLGDMSLFIDKEKKRVRVFDYWYKQNEVVELAVNMDTGDVKTLDDDFKEKLAMSDGEVRQAFQIHRRKVSTVRIATIINWLLVQDKITPFSHRYFPITSYIGLQFQGEPRGPVEYLKDPQRLKNKAISQAMNHLNRSANSGWMNHATEGADPAVLEKFGSKAGIVINHNGQEPKQITPSPFSQGHAQLVQFAGDQIKNTSSVNAEIQGQVEGARTVSGKAIESRQKGGLVGNEDLFDNALLGDKIVGLQLISLVQSLYTPLRVQRIVENQKIRRGESSSLAKIFAEKKELLPEIIASTLKEEYDYIIDKSGGGLTARQDLADKMTQLATEWAKHGPVPISLIISTLDQYDIPSGDKDAIKQELKMQQAQQQMMQQAQLMQGMAGMNGGQNETPI